ncbi:PqiB family protein [Caminibacter sp.]
MEEIVEVKIKKKEINLIIWLLPIISLLIAGWLIYKYYASLGPVIDIYFKNSGGLEPKKSFVRFRDVKVGVVEDVVLLKNGVLVKVRMHKDVEPFLNDTTKFWIVTPTIEVGKIKGLEALITGPYIQMYAKSKGFTKKVFKGLKQPPLNPDILNGKIITLYSNDSYSLSEKMPVYYKSIKVGSIRRVELDKNRVKIVVSIKREYAKYINDTTKFWNLRGIDITLDKDNLKVVVPGISQLLIGGIEFDTLEMNKPITKRSFYLYSSRSDAYDNILGNKRMYSDVVFKVVNDKNALIKVGNPVIFKGFKIGYVQYISSKYDIKTGNVISIVHAKIDTGAFGGKDKFMDVLKKGLSSIIVKNNPLFGNVKIKLVFSKPYKINYLNGIIEIKVIKKREKSIFNSVMHLIDKVNSLDLKKPVKSLNILLKNLNLTVLNANRLIKNSNKVVEKLPELIDNINITVIKASNALKSIKNLSDSYSKDSIFYIKMNELLKEIHNNLGELYKLEKKIDKKPNALIFGE